VQTATGSRRTATAPVEKPAQSEVATASSAIRAASTSRRRNDEFDIMREYARRDGFSRTAVLVGTRPRSPCGKWLPRCAKWIPRRNSARPVTTGAAGLDPDGVVFGTAAIGGARSYRAANELSVDG
jgi:hypothetical protein